MNKRGIKFIDFSGALIHTTCLQRSGEQSCICNIVRMKQEEFDRQFVEKISDVPVTDDKRNCTDFFCFVVNTAFVIILLIISIAVYNNNELIKMSLPNDDEGHVCGFDGANDFTILYYPDYNDPNVRVCVSQCPDKNDKKVECFATEETPCESLLPVQTDTQFEHTRIGLFCFPEDQSEKDTLLENVGLSKRYHFLGYYDAMWRSFYISSLLSIVFVVLVQLFPLKMVPWTILVGGIFALVFGLVIMIISTGSIIGRIVFVLIMLGLAAAFMFTLFKPERRKQVFTCARLVEVSTTVFRENFLTAVYIPIFILFFFILLALVGFETLAAWSFSYFNFDPEYPFYRLSGFGSVFLQILIAIEFIWGLCFLKEACNFCVSGVSTQWYFYRRNDNSKVSVFSSFKNLFRFHWGSVLGCAFLTGFFYIIDFITDFFFNSDTEDHKNEDVEYVDYEALREDKRYEQKNSCLTFLDLCRSETMSYINLVSIPYCNAARYAEQLSRCSDFYDYSQTTNRVYRLAAHIVLMSIVTFVSLLSVKAAAGHASITGIFWIALISLFTVTFFIGLHGDLAEGLLMSTFVEEAFEVDTNEVHKLTIPQEEMRDVYYDDVKGKYENKNLKDLLLGLTKESHKDKDDEFNKVESRRSQRSSDKEEPRYRQSNSSDKDRKEGRNRRKSNSSSSSERRYYQ